MANLKDCIDSAVAQGGLTYDEGQRLKDRYDAIAQRTFSAAAGREQFIAELEADAFQKQRKARLIEKVREERLQDIMSHRSARGEVDPIEAVVWLLENEGQARFQDVETRRRVLMGLSHAKMERLLHEFSGKFKVSGDLGRRMNAAKMNNIVKELFGQDTGDQAAKGLAKAWMETAEDLRLKFNAAGGNIGKLDRWGLPQHHDVEALINAGPEKWKSEITPLLDRKRMVDDLTGRPLSDDELSDVLDTIYQNIITDGWSRREPSMQPYGKGALYKQHADHRFLHFDGPDKWMRYQKDFGSGDPYTVMMAHISTMTRDIAFMQILGPNPQAMLNYLKQAGEKYARTRNPNGKLARKVKSWNHTADVMFDNMRGNGNLENNWLSHTGTFLRNITTSTTLGSGLISAVSDPTFQKATRSMAGMTDKKGWGRIVGGYARQLSAGGQQIAVRNGLILDSTIHVMHKQARYSNATQLSGVSGYLADRTLALTGLTPFTQAGKHAFGMDMMAHVVDTLNTPYAKLNRDWRNFLSQNGITEVDWGTLRTVNQSTEGGLTLLRPKDVEAVNEDLALRYMGMIHRFVRVAIPEPGVRARAAMTAGMKGGTLGGELARLITQFKGFSVGIIFLHMMPLYRDLVAGRWGSAAARGGALVINMTLLGALAMQLKEMVNGRDPRNMNPMDQPNFWAAAMLQGGGLGIYGDLLFADVNRFGGGLGSMISGPVVSKIIDPARNLTIGNIIEGYEGKDTNFGREATRFVGQNTPFLSSAWYARLAYDRMFIDQVRKMVDPGAERSFRRTERYRDRNFGQDYWWGEGEMAPDRAPDLGAAFGE